MPAFLCESIINSSNIIDTEVLFHKISVLHLLLNYYTPLHASLTFILLPSHEIMKKILPSRQLHVQS